MESANEQPIPEPSRRTSYALLAVVAALTFLVYAQTVQFDFVTYDDGVYVTESSRVKGGISTEGIRYAFTTGETGTWQPLTLISHMIDCTVFGMRPGGHHLTNVLLHAANTFLLGFVLLRMTGCAGASVFVAAVFGLHPAHVESVAWISERKDVLSTFFFMATLLAYARWAETLHMRWLGITSLCMAAGLLAKPMLVTLPFVLLLLDYWPLNRVWCERRIRCLTLLLLEKIPLFILAACASLATLVVQRNAQAMSSWEALPLGMRLENAVMANVRYIGKTLWPVDFAMFYPHPLGTTDAWQLAIALGILIAITVFAIVVRNRAPFVLVGWLWYLGALLPVIGIVQVGIHAIADRYTYIPMIGLSIMVAFAGRARVLPRSESAAYCGDGTERVPEGLESDGGIEVSKRAGTRALPLACVVVICLLAVLTWRQVGVWRNSETLYRHTLEIMPNNPVANMGLGLYLVDVSRDAEAIPHLELAVAAKHRLSDAHYHLGLAYQHLGEFERAREHYETALAADASSSRAWNNLGVTLDALQRYGKAEQAFQHAIERDLFNHEANYNLGALRIKLRRPVEAEALARDVIVRSPNVARYHLLLALALFAQGNNAGALDSLQETLRIDPANTVARQLRATLLRTVTKSP
ncbi:MAG: tetratricopeptide repeat protein [Candidatus Hydrogenedentes bacterium]|nr:tetratricopeptide repeat protein [Candidatus Hydrogenedentota bacterium]